MRALRTLGVVIAMAGVIAIAVQNAALPPAAGFMLGVGYMLAAALIVNTHASIKAARGVHNDDAAPERFHDRYRNDPQPSGSNGKVSNLSGEARA